MKFFKSFRESFVWLLLTLWLVRPSKYHRLARLESVDFVTPFFFGPHEDLEELCVYWLWHRDRIDWLDQTSVWEDRSVLRRCSQRDRVDFSLTTSSRIRCWHNLICWSIGRKSRRASTMSTSCRNNSMSKWRHCVFLHSMRWISFFFPETCSLFRFQGWRSFQIDKNDVYLLSKQLDEKVTRLQLLVLGVRLIVLSQEQAKCTCVEAASFLSRVRATVTEL